MTDPPLLFNVVIVTKTSRNLIHKNQTLFDAQWLRDKYNDEAKRDGVPFKDVHYAIDPA